MEQTLNVYVNGQPRQVPAGQSVSSLLELLNIKADRVAVELDKTLVRKRDWSETSVGDQASIEIVEFVGGG